MFKAGLTGGGRHHSLLTTVGLAILLILLLSSPGILGASEDSDPGDGKLFEVPPPPLSDDYFPCSMCHEDMEVNRERRELTEEHLEIVLKHDEEHRWCLDCHDADNRDVLRLASGTPVEFTESYVLCGQCHGPKIRDWRAGVHGKRTGNWRGDKQYLLCVHCHDPHAPRFKPLEPMPPPLRPENLR